MRFSIRLRLATAMGVLVAGSFAVGTLVAERQLRASFEGERTRQAQQEAARLETRIETLSLLLEDKTEQVLSEHPDVLAAIDGSIDDEGLEPLRAALEVQILVVVDPRRRMVTATGDEVPVVDLPEDTLIRRALSHGVADTDIVWRGHAFELRSVHPIYGQGEIIGVVVAAHWLDLRWLTGQIREIEGAHAGLLYEATVIASTTPAFDRADSGVIFEVKDRVAQGWNASDDANRFVQQTVVLGDEVYDAVYCPLPMATDRAHLGTLVLLVSASNMQGALTQARTAMIGTGVIGLILAVALAALFAVGLSRPIRTLADAAMAMRAGNLSRRTGLTRNDEIGQLSRAFDAMAESLQRHVESVRALAVTDELTGLANRRRFDEELEREITRHSRFGSPLCLLFLDIDHFKRVNDTHGHPEGDVVLRNIADMLTQCVRAVDIPARYGGEEFAVLLPNTPLDAAVMVAERIRATVEATSVGSRDHLHVTISAGAAAYPDEAKTADELHQVADGRLYRAKEAGRNRVVAGDD